MSLCSISDSEKTLRSALSQILTAGILCTLLLVLSMCGKGIAVGLKLSTPLCAYVSGIFSAVIWMKAATVEGRDQNILNFAAGALSGSAVMFSSAIAMMPEIDISKPRWECWSCWLSYVTVFTAVAIIFANFYKARKEVLGQLGAERRLGSNQKNRNGSDKEDTFPFKEQIEEMVDAKLVVMYKTLLQVSCEGPSLE